MQRYVTLAEGNKHNRRSVADAIELLAAHADFRANNLATIRTLQLPIPARKPLFQLCVAFENLSSNVTSLVWLPTSSCFNAQGLDQRRANKFATADLDGAMVDFAGNVSLPTGAQLRAVEVVPATLPYELSDLEWRILECTIKYMKIEDVVVRTFGEELDVDVRATLPVIRRIDFQRLKGFEVPPLKVLQHFIIENVRDLEDISLEKISSALSKCGMRSVVRRRPPPPHNSRLIEGPPRKASLGQLQLCLGTIDATLLP